MQPRLELYSAGAPEAATTLLVIVLDAIHCLTAASARLLLVAIPDPARIDTARQPEARGSIERARQSV